MKKLTLCLLLASALIAPPLWAQEAIVPAPAIPVDPTLPDATLQQFLSGQNANGKASAPAGLPSMLLRGKLLSPRRPAIVVIEIDKQLVTMSEGVSATLAGPFAGLTVTLEQVTAQEVILKVDPPARTIRLH